MANTLAELRQRRTALNAEADTMLAAAIADGDRNLIAAEATRLTAIKAELAGIETERAALEDTMHTDAEMTAAVTAAVTEAVTKAVTAANKRGADIVAACELAGKLKSAHAFLIGSKSAEEVVAELKADAPAEDEINTRSGKRVANPDTAKLWETAQAKANARVK